MKRWVDFDWSDEKKKNPITPIRGEEGGPTPIDKAAELVLSSTVTPITRVRIAWEDGIEIEWKVVARSDTHVGASGTTTSI